MQPNAAQIIDDNAITILEVARTILAVQQAAVQRPPEEWASGQPHNIKIPGTSATAQFWIYPGGTVYVYA
jgi:hypothetical protein